MAALLSWWSAWNGLLRFPHTGGNADAGAGVGLDAGLGQQGKRKQGAIGKHCY